MGSPSDHSQVPHWDLSAIYTGLDAADFRADFDAWSAAITDLVQLFDRCGIGAAPAPLPADTDTIRSLETAIEAINAVHERGHRLRAYVSGHVATDSRNASAQTWMSRIQMQMAVLDKLDPRFTAWVGRLDLDAVTAASTIAAAHLYRLRTAQTEAAHLMSPAEEDLAADLNTTGGRAWSRFYSNFSSQITAQVEVDGATQTLPITAVRNLAYVPDRETRKRAYDAEIAAWKANAMPIASALNSIKGQANTLNRRRGWASPLDLALFDNAIDHATLDAMLGTARTFFPHFRRYLKAKAALLGIDACAWYDLFAPVPARVPGEAGRTWSFGDAADFIVEQFGSFSPSLAGVAQRAFSERWIDAEPRDGKRGGAFCMWTGGDTSRILSNFQPAYGGMSTLAHELGHAYHNRCRAGCTYMQHGAPMTLAETASTFCQIIVRNAALRDAGPSEQLAILEADLQDSTQVIVDITSRVLFETAAFDRRAERELSADEFCAIMIDSQRATYADGLGGEDAYHPYMWAVKPHYYSAIFYNFPYMFGLLFGLGLYAQFREHPGGFVERYESLLANTGMANAVDLAQRFGIDITRPAFWEGSLHLIVEDVDRFVELSTISKGPE